MFALTPIAISSHVSNTISSEKSRPFCIVLIGCPLLSNSLWDEANSIVIFWSATSNFTCCDFDLFRSLVVLTTKACSSDSSPFTSPLFLLFTPAALPSKSTTVDCSFACNRDPFVAAVCQPRRQRNREALCCATSTSFSRTASSAIAAVSRASCFNSATSALCSYCS